MPFRRGMRVLLVKQTTKRYLRTNDDARVGAALLAVLSAPMGDRDLLDAEACGLRADQDLGVDEGAERLDRNRLEDLASEYLERAVDVAHRESEQRANE